MLSFKQLSAVFIVAFLVLFVALMPARVVVGWIGVDKYISFDRVHGGLFQARLEGVEARGIPLGAVEISPDAAALLTGSFEGALSFSGMGRSGHMQVVSMSASHAVLNNASLITPVALAHQAWPLSGDVALTAETLTFDLAQGCTEGDFTLRTDMFTPAVRAFGGQELILEGTGRCNNGRLTADLEGENAQVGLAVTLALSPQGMLAAEIALQPKMSTDAQENLQTMLNFAGLQRQNDGKWHGRINAPMTF